MEKSTATSKSKLDKKMLIILGVIVILVLAGILAWSKLRPTESNDDTQENSSILKVFESDPDKTYTCNNYLGFGYSFEVVYNNDGLVSVNTSNGSTTLETEQKRLEESYQGNVENYINTVKALCED